MSARYDFGIVYNGHHKVRDIYVFGGSTHHNEHYLDTCERYSIEKYEWTPLSPMLSAKAEVSACLVNHQFIYLIGGF